MLINHWYRLKYSRGILNYFCGDNELLHRAILNWYHIPLYRWRVEYICFYLYIVTIFLSIIIRFLVHKKTTYVAVYSVKIKSFVKENQNARLRFLLPVFHKLDLHDRDEIIVYQIYQTHFFAQSFSFIWYNTQRNSHLITLIW